MGCSACTEAAGSHVGMGLVTHAGASGTVGSHRIAARASAALPHWWVFSIIFVRGPAKGLHTSMPSLGGACCYTWKKETSVS